WIASSSANVPQIEIIAPGYLWPSFIVSPIVVYLDYTLNISGTVTWDNATPYANSPVDFFWGDPFGVWDTIQLDVLTDGSGNFYYEFTVPASTPIGDRQVWAYIDPAGFATAGMSPTPTITVAIIGVDITTGVDTTMLYLNEDITFSGTLTFTNNMSGMIGYEIQIWWAGEFLTSITISDPAGAFSYVYTIPWDTDPRVVTPNYALFEPPNVSFGTSDITLNFPDVTVMELVDVFLDPEPVDNTVSRGDTLIVTGYVDNNGGFDADSVEVEALSDGNPTSFTAITRADGTFTISIDVPLSALPGSYNISVWVVSPYHNMRNGPINWWIDVFIASEVGVTINQVSVLPSESFLVTVQLRDDEGTSLAGESISLSLGSTYIRDILIPVSGETTVLVNVPSDWTDDGYFTVTVYYAGRPFIDPDTFETVDTIHVFTEVIFQRITAARIDPGQPVTIQMSLVDGSDNPILNRNVRLRVNSTDTFNLSTGDDGQITQGMGSYPDGTSLTFALTLLSTEVTPIQSGIFTINIETTGGNPLQGTELLVAGILLVGAVIAVLAYLYIVRGMFRSSAGISRGFDIPTKLRNIKKLADAGKYGASITLAYRTFEQMCGSKMSSERSHNETAREYLERVLQAIPLDLATTEQFVQTYEEARFSHHEMTRERYEEAVRIFTDLYPRIDSSAPVE
ncbi:MAG: DUF4129 domain-containing protein, partial [Candidatus Thorarchaeota archaeon]